MKVTFNLYHNASENQRLSITILGPQDRYAPMNYIGNNQWTLEIDLDENTPLQYRYCTNETAEWGQPRTITLNNLAASYCIDDTWRTQPLDVEKYTAAFTDVFYAPKPSKNTNYSSQIEIQLTLSNIPADCEAVMVGENSALGSWNASLAPRFNCKRFPYHTLNLALSEIRPGTNYKFAIVNSASGALVRWEEGPNRVWSHNLPYDQHYILHDQIFRESSVYKWRGAGVAVPVFSLRSENSAGIGDFADLARFAQWVAQIGGQIVQILPVNDTTISHSYADSYPYNAISVFALHPLYLSLEKMGVLQDAALAHTIAEELQRISPLEQLDYEDVDRIKWMFFRAMYLQQGRETLQSDDFKVFYADNKDWLAPYAVFSFLRELNGTADYREWGEWSKYDAKKAEFMLSENCGEYDNIAIHLYLQFHLHKQLSQARDTASAAGVALKGDIPIGVSRFSVDTWVNPHLFNLNVQAGAPPDDFAIEGQNWGFPTYNWAEMAKNNYEWWKRRFAKMADYFQLYRIDHILGFFRIWQIPTTSVRGLLGYFNPAMPFDTKELENYGFDFKEEYLVPHFSRTELKELLGKHRNVVNDYFEPLTDGILTMREQYNTQRKIANIIPDEALAHVLMQALEDVLFVCDDSGAAAYHPRISGASTFAYRRLSDTQKQAYDAMYNDYYYHRHNDFWATGAREKLPALINATRMMCCAEDLGMIPDCVNGVLTDLRVVTLEIERMPKLAGECYGNVLAYQYMSVCTTSTHDMSPIRLWWQEMNDQQREYYYNHSLAHFDNQPPNKATTEICQAIITRHLDAPSILTIIPLQDWLATNETYWQENIEQERINIPSEPHHYWRYRMQPTIEELMQDKTFAKELRQLIVSSKRL